MPVTLPDGVLAEPTIRKLASRRHADLQRLTGLSLHRGVRSCGASGCIIASRDGRQVVKITTDPVETDGWLFVGTHQAVNPVFGAGFVRVGKMWKAVIRLDGFFGDVDHVVGIGVLERAIPAMSVEQTRGDTQALRRAKLPISRTGGLRSPVKKALAGLQSDLDHDRFKAFRRKARNCAKRYPELAGLCAGLQAALDEGANFWDSRYENVGWRVETEQLVLLDLGEVVFSRTLRRQLERRWRNAKAVDLR